MDQYKMGAKNRLKQSYISPNKSKDIEKQLHYSVCVCACVCFCV